MVSHTHRATRAELKFFGVLRALEKQDGGPGRNSIPHCTVRTAAAAASAAVKADIQPRNSL